MVHAPPKSILIWGVVVFRGREGRGIACRSQGCPSPALSVASTLRLAPPQAIAALHRLMDSHGNGLVELADWMRILGRADVESVLKSDRVIKGDAEWSSEHASGSAAGSSGSSTRNPQDISNTIAALLKYNNMTFSEGFVEFDADEDGEISLSDLLHVIQPDSPPTPRQKGHFRTCFHPYFLSSPDGSVPFRKIGVYFQSTLEFSALAHARAPSPRR